MRAATASTTVECVNQKIFGNKTRTGRGPFETRNEVITGSSALLFEKLLRLDDPVFVIGLKVWKPG